MSFAGLLFLVSLILLPASCRKPDSINPKKTSAAQAQSMDLPLQIHFEDVAMALPQTILYNLGDSVKFYLGQSTYSYMNNYLVVHIPTTQDGLNYIFAAKSTLNPGRTLVYAVRFFPAAESTPTSYTGKMIWINFQNGMYYGFQYQNNTIVSYMEPKFLANPGWEQCMIDNSEFGIGADGKIIVNDTASQNIAMRGGIPCPNDPTKGQSNLWGSLGDFFSGIGDVIGGIFDGGSGASNNGGDWNGLPGGIWLPGGDPGGDPPGGGGGGGNQNPPPDGNDPPGSDDDNNPFIVTPVNSAISTGLYAVDDQGHGPNPGTPVFDYHGTIVGSATSVQLVGIKDANGFFYSRITALQVYLQSHPYGMIDCGDLSNMPTAVQQEVGNYQIPQAVTDRIDNIRSTYSPQYNQNNFHIQKLQDALGGVVNCDYFPVHVTQLPKNSNNQTMTPLEFLEYFRTNINFLIGLGGQGGANGTHFYAYQDNNVNFYDGKYYSDSYALSVGALVHIEIGPAFDNGSVIESGYQTTSSSNNYWFMVTTMHTPLDADHPVSGNRRFGIFQNSDGSYTFYTMGVDRTTNISTTIANWSLFGNQAFSGADNLWHAVQDGLISDIISEGGQASLYIPRDRIARPDWSGPVKDYLKGLINFQQMKNELNCP